MDLEPLLKDVAAYAKATQAVAKGLQEIGKLDGKRADNLQALHKLLKKLKTDIGALGVAPEPVKRLSGWTPEYEALLAETLEELKKDFGRDLDALLREKGSRLTVHYPTLQAGLLTRVPGWMPSAS